jgi:hypothetical protein
MNYEKFKCHSGQVPFLFLRASPESSEPGRKIARVRLVKNENPRESTTQIVIKDRRRIFCQEGFRVKLRIHEQLDQSKDEITSRLRMMPDLLEDKPVFQASGIRYEIAERTRAICYGGVGMMMALAQKVGLIEAIDRRVHVLKLHVPYHESDHIMNIALNALCDGTCLEDIELRRNDAAFLNALGVNRIPDPTTAGDFCRRFTCAASIQRIEDAIHDARKNVWRQQPSEFFAEGTIDLDGSQVETDGEKKAGVDIGHDGRWGYHPLIASLAETGEVLSIINRSGNRPSHEGAAAVADRYILRLREAGFRRIWLRGDTDFSQSQHLDRWDDQPDVRFVFGFDAHPKLRGIAEGLPDDAWRALNRPGQKADGRKKRKKRKNVKDAIVEAREFRNLCLEQEDIAEFPYQPGACVAPYRMVVVRKTIKVHKGQLRLLDETRYFFYITNEFDEPQEKIVCGRANKRCNQENLLAQLHGGVRALTAPVDNLYSNWAYMQITALAWNLKAWSALILPEQPGTSQEQHRHEKRTVLRMEFKTFLNYFMQIPCQIVKTGGRVVYRLLSWNPQLPVFFRMTEVLRI